MTKMNYKVAITTSKPCTSSTSNIIVSQESREEYLKSIERTEFQKRANTQMNEVVNRFIAYKREELKLENYENEEIEKIIQDMISNENDNYYDYSSDEDDDSVYSDEDSFWIKLNNDNYYKLFK